MSTFYLCETLKTVWPQNVGHSGCPVWPGPVLGAAHAPTPSLHPPPPCTLHCPHTQPLPAPNPSLHTPLPREKGGLETLSPQDSSDESWGLRCHHQLCEKPGVPPLAPNTTVRWPLNREEYTPMRFLGLWGLLGPLCTLPGGVPESSASRGGCREVLVAERTSPKPR